MNRLTIALAIIASGLILLLFNSSAGKTFGMNNDDFAGLISFTAIATVMTSGLLASRERLRPALKMLLIWLVLILSVTTTYVFRSELFGIADRIASGIMPGRVSVSADLNGRAIISVSKNVQGHFTATVNANGHDITMLVDTGASDVALTFEDAERLGLDPASLSFNRTVSTANGNTVSAPVTIDSLQIGPIVRNHIRASVALKGRLDQSLLGMSYLSTLSGVEIIADQLKLTD